MRNVIITVLLYLIGYTDIISQLEFHCKLYDWLTIQRGCGMILRQPENCVIYSSKDSIKFSASSGYDYFCISFSVPCCIHPIFSMSHKHNGAMVQPAGPKGNRKDAGDDSHSNCSSHGDVPTVVYPENIQKRLNALKNTHMEVQKLEQEMHVKLFLLEAQYHQQMTPLLKKRAEIISGTYEPTANEIKFELPEGSPIVETTPADGSIGIPKFWFTVLSNCMLTNEWIEEHDEEVLGYLQDIRVVYEEKPLGFKLEFEFAENLYFTNKVLARSYVFDEALNKEELYVNNGLTPKSTSGTVIDWKEGKNLTKKVTVAQQVRKFEKLRIF